MKIDAALKDKKKKAQPIPDKTVKVLASSIYRSLKDEGCQNKDIIGVSSQLIGLVTSALEADKKSL